MRNKITLLLLTLFSVLTTQAQCIDYVYIPDANFKTALVANLEINTNGDAEISCDEASVFTGTIRLESKSITSLTGIEYFINITELDCSGNGNLRSIDVSNNIALEILDCDFSGLTSLYLWNNTNLRELYCRNNDLTSLNLYNNKALKNLKCGNNELISLDVSSNTALEYISCFNNELTSLDISNNIYVETLLCMNNRLVTLDMSDNTYLERLWCYGNELISLDVSDCIALIELNCYSNQLTSLDVSNNLALIELNCYSNQLTSLDVSNNLALRELYCSNNELINLNMANGYNTEISSFGISMRNNPNLSCIQVDNVDYSNANWIDKIGERVSFNTNCNAILSVTDNEFSESVSVYPNPVIDVLNINLKTGGTIATVQVYNLLGEEILRSTNNVLGVSHLSSGIYLVEVITVDEEIGVSKIVKK